MRSADEYYTSSAPGWPTKATPARDILRGAVVEREVTQQREYDTRGPGDPLWWVDGKPKASAEPPKEDSRPVEQNVVTLQTELRDPAIDHDDGQRRLFIKGKRMDAAARAALKEAGARGNFAVGGYLEVAVIGYDPESKNPDNPARLYAMRYTPPTTPADDYFSDPANGSSTPPEDPWASTPAQAPPVQPPARTAPPQAAPAADPWASAQPVTTGSPWGGDDPHTAHRQPPAPAGVNPGTGEITEPWLMPTSPVPNIDDATWRGYSADVRKAMWNMYSGGLTATG